MRVLDQNKQKLYYSNYIGRVPIYAYDEDGNVLTQVIDGETVQVVSSHKEVYSKPESFMANISYDSGETTAATFGLDVSDYDAIVCINKGKYPFNEQTIIWTNEPEVENDEVVSESAEYKIIADKSSLNEQRFILKKRVNEGVINISPS